MSHFSLVHWKKQQDFSDLESLKMLHHEIYHFLRSKRPQKNGRFALSENDLPSDTIHRPFRAPSSHFSASAAMGCTSSSVPTQTTVEPEPETEHGKARSSLEIHKILGMQVKTPHKWYPFKDPKKWGGYLIGSTWGGYHQTCFYGLSIFLVGWIPPQVDGRISWNFAIDRCQRSLLCVPAMQGTFPA